MTKFDLRHFLSRLYLMISFLLYGASCFAGIDPNSGTYNFGVVTRGDATFWSGDTHSPVFVGGNLSITNAFDFSNNHAGTLTFSGDTKPAHLVVRGTINLNGNNSNGHVNGGGFLKVGTKGNLSYGKPSGNPAAVNNSGAFLQVNEPSQTESSMMVTTAVIDNKINKETLFSSFKANSDQLKACGANTSITDEYGGRFSMQLQNNRTNVIGISKTQLTNLSEFIFKNQAPSASSPLLINVDMQGGSVDFSAPIYVGSGVNLGDINALGKYVIYNFYNGGTTNNTVNILYGTPSATIYAPYSKVVKKLSSGDIEGQIIADSYIHEGGEVHYQIFDADLSCVNTVTECTGCVSKNLIYNPDFSASNAIDGWIVQTSSSNVSFGVFNHNFGGSTGNKRVGQLNWNDVVGNNYVRQVVTDGVVPGKTYTFTAQAANHRGTTNPARSKMWLEFLNSQGVVLSTSIERNVTTPYSSATSFVFQNISITGTIPPNTAQIRIVGYANQDALKFLNSLLVVDCYDAVNATSVNVNANCLDQSGKITVNATGGSGQYQYYIKKGTGNWSSAQASNVFDNLTSASYTIRVEDKNIDKAECKKEFNVVIGKDPIPAKPNVTNKEICLGESTTLTAGNCASGSTLKWYSNAGLTTEITNLTVNPAETKDYYAACVGTCKSEGSKLTITVKPRLTISVDSKTICEGESATLTATNCTGNVTWNTGATGATLTVNPTGTLTYTATCSKSGSCDATASGTVTVNPKPTVSVDSKTICIGESATLTATCAGGTVTWNTGATGTTLTVSPTTSTTYTATCKSSANCSATATGRITVNEKPTVTVSNSGNITCVSGSVITASATPSNGVTYIWTVPAGVTNPGNQASFTANVPGTYSVKVKNNTTNCESEIKSTVVTEDKNTPTITATGGELTCAKPSVTLSATAVTGASYVWKRGTTEVGTTREVSVSVAGTYTVTVTFANGCTSTATAVVTEDKNTPTITATGGELTCAKPNVTLTATAVTGASYVWKLGTTEVGTTREVSVSVAGTYTVTVTFANGCTSTATAVVTEDRNTPAITATGGELTCAKPSVTLSATAVTGASYVWKRGTTEVGTTREVSVSVAGTYTVTVTFPNGCTSTATAVVTEDKNTPTITATGGELTCAKSSVTLTATAVTGASYVWKLGTTEVGTTREVSVSVAGTYTVTVTFANGCTSTATAVVTEDKNTPTITATGGELTCAKPSVTLSATAVTGASYVWKLGTTEVGTTREISISAAGTYTVTVTFANGCTSTATAVVTENKNTPTITATGGELTCAKPSVTLSATAVTGASYVWKLGTTEVGTTREVSVSVAGTYMVTVTFPNGCTSTATAVVTEDKNTPSITATGGELTCAKPSVTLSATAVTGASYVWKLGTTEVGTTREVSVSVAGTYTVTVTFPNGCTSTATAVVTEDKNTPTITATGGELTCAKPNVTLSATAVTGASYVWKLGTTEVGTTREVSVSVAGTYTVTVTFPNGCTSTATAVVTEDKNTPTITATGGELTCAKPNVTLSATAVTGASYVWKLGTTEVGTTREVSVSVAGTYTVTVTFPNGCTSTATAVVTEDKNTPTITATGGELTCAKPSVTLSVTVVTGASYVWKRGTTEVGTTREVSVSVAGTYSVTVTFPNGCTSTATAVVTEDKNTPTITATGGELTCAKPSLTLTATAVTGASYVWKLGTTEVGTTREVSVSVAGTYTVTVTFPNGCTSTATAVVTEDKNTPSITATGGELTCAKPSVTLSATAVTGASYVWKLGTTEVGTTREVSVSVAGTYTVTVTFPNGCTSTATAVVTEDKNTPSITAIGGELTCAKPNVTLSATAVTGASYVWKLGTTEVGTTREVSVSVAGTYTVTVTFPNGCTSTATAVVTEDKNTPTITATGGELTCAKPNVTLSATAVTGASYVWKLGTTEVGTTREVSVSVAGTYTVTVTFPNGCTSTATAVVTEDKNTPSITASGGELTCAKPSVTLSATAVTGASYVWKLGTTEVGTTREVSVSADGTYTVTVTFSNGCSTSATTVVSKDTEVPTVIVEAGKLTCINKKVTIAAAATGEGTLTYKWTVPAGVTNPGNVASFETETPGVYSIEVTSENGCKVSDQIEVIEDLTAPVVEVKDKVIACDLTEVTLVAEATGAVSYSWTGPAGFTSTSREITVSTVGTYTVTVTSLVNGCTATDMGVVTKQPNPGPPQAGPYKVCFGEEITLTAVCATGTAKWFSDADLTQQVTVLTFVPEETHTYYAVCGLEDCFSEPTQSVVTVIPDFPAPVLSADPEEVIQGKSSTLSGTCQTGTLVWYKDEAITEVLGTGATLVVTPPATTTYYAACEVEDCKKTSEIIVKVKDQIFDLALRKTIKGGAKNPVVYPGGSITFEIEIFNQGNVGASNIEVTDYIPEGLILSDAAWSMNGTDKAVLTIDTLAPQASVVKEITFTIASDFRGKAINAAEISDAEGGEDIDSTPDDNPTNDGTPKDDEIDEDGKNGGDEDDHDIEEITVEDKPVFDLALRKTIKGGAKNPIMKIGQELTFVITVFNQGNVEAKNIEVVDYIPSGLTLVDTLNWNVVGNKAYLKTPIASLASSASQTIEVKFRINQSASGEVINFAEISSAENDQNLEDIDSTPDDDPSNDGVSKDDVITENGKEGGDEDDHDMEKIQICPDSKCLTAKVRVNKGV